MSKVWLGRFSEARKPFENWQNNRAEEYKRVSSQQSYFRLVLSDVIYGNFGVIYGRNVVRFCREILVLESEILFHAHKKEAPPPSAPSFHDALGN